LASVITFANRRQNDLVEQISGFPADLFPKATLECRKLSQVLFHARGAFREQAFDCMSVTIPLSLTDFVKALRELVALVKDTEQLIGDGVQLYDRRRSKKAAERLYALSFTPQGMRSALKRIGAGQGSGEDFALRRIIA
jgi:hypothetical protein